jgi:hypothetical protein
LFNLFAGTRVSKSFGKAETTIAGSSDLTGGAGITAGSTTLSISEESKPDGIDMFLYGGAEVKILILTVTGKVGYNLNNKNYTIDGGLRMQF